MAITQARRHKGTYPFEVCHTSSRSTYRQKMGPKGLKHLGNLPRKFQLNSHLYVSILLQRCQFLLADKIEHCCLIRLTFSHNRKAKSYVVMNRLLKCPLNL